MADDTPTPSAESRPPTEAELWLLQREVFLDADQRARAFTDELVFRAGTVWLEQQNAALEAERNARNIAAAERNIRLITGVDDA